MRTDYWKQKIRTVGVLHKIARCRKDAGIISVRGPTKT